MGYLTGTDLQSVDLAVCLNGILTLLYLHKQTEMHFCSQEGKQKQSGRVKLTRRQHIATACLHGINTSGSSCALTLQSLCLVPNTITESITSRRLEQ